jgi:hypothetical protein
VLAVVVELALVIHDDVKVTFEEGGWFGVGLLHCNTPKFSDFRMLVGKIINQ